MKFIGRWKYTIVLAVVILLCIYGIGALVKGDSACEKKGGVYARTMNGTYKCLKEIK